MIEGVTLKQITTHTDEHGSTFIYGLFDPRDYRLRYIGKADNPEFRLLAHVRESMDMVGRNPIKETWISGLLTEGLMPSVEILEEVPVSQWQQVEQAWIKEAREKGLNLVNIANGGEGGAIRFGSHAQETINKIKASKQNISNETRKRLSNSGKSGWPKRK